MDRNALFITGRKVTLSAGTKTPSQHLFQERTSALRQRAMTMSLSPKEDPNATVLAPPDKSSYLSVRLIVHTGVTIAVALRSDTNRKLTFEYFVLDTQAGAQNGTSQPTAGAPHGRSDATVLDAQGWSQHPKALVFPNEVRVAGFEAIPTLTIPSVDRSGHRSNTDSPDQSNLWDSTSLFLTANVTDFELVSDGQYLYLFRQAISTTDSSQRPLLNSHVDRAHLARTVNGNLLCDRFLLLDGTLTSPLEVRYRRSGQKSLPANESDTLGVKDMNDAFFREPTLSLTFVSDMVRGKFTILRLPTAATDVSRWTFFVPRPFPAENEITVYSVDSTSNCLFDLHGKSYYTCGNTSHDAVFSTAPGPCTAVDPGTSDYCRQPKIPIIAKDGRTEHCLTLGVQNADAVLALRKPIDLTSDRFSGCVIEAWVMPPTPPKATVENGEPQFPEGLVLTIFGFDLSLSVALDHRNRLSLARTEGRGLPKVLVSTDSEHALRGDQWNHVAVIFPHVPLGDRAAPPQLVVNGVSAPAVPTIRNEAAAVAAELDFRPTRLTHLGSNSGSSVGRFVGRFDEIRVWRTALSPEAINATKSKRVTGAETLLETAWHMDESSGTVLYDSGPSDHPVDILLEKPAGGSVGWETDALTEIWCATHSPALSSSGMSRTTIRLDPSIKLTGGLSASIYYEQTTADVSTETNAGRLKSDNATASSTTKPLKRCARVLLSTIASKNGIEGDRLLILDFGLHVNGSLSGTPGVVTVPALMTSQSADGETRCPTSLLHIDSEGVELYGGIIADSKVQCLPDAPCVWDSAVGSICIYFRSKTGILSSLSYDISRSIVVADTAASVDDTAAGVGGLKLGSRLRNASEVRVRTAMTEWAPSGVSVSLVVEAKLESGMMYTEVWRGLPTDPVAASDILAGHCSGQSQLLGIYVSLQVKLRDSKGVPAVYELDLYKPVQSTVPVASFICIESTYFQVLRTVDFGEQSMLLSRPYVLEGEWFDAESPSGQRASPPAQDTPANTKSAPLRTPLDDMKLPVGSDVLFIPYDFVHMVSSHGKPLGDMSKGSTIVTAAASAREDTAKTSKINVSPSLVPHQSVVLARKGAATPSLHSGHRSTSLRLSGEHVFSRLEANLPVTAACSGLTFESWIKVDDLSTESVVVTYTSEKASLGLDGENESQSFVAAAVPTRPADHGYYLQGSINGRPFRVDNTALIRAKWVHLACSYQNVYAMALGSKGYVDFGSGSEFNLNDFSLLVAFELDVIEPKTDRLILTKAVGTQGVDAVTPIHLVVLADGRIRVSFHADDPTTSGQTIPKAYEVISPSGVIVEPKKGYKLFVSRKLATITSKVKAPRQGQLVTLKLWTADGKYVGGVIPPTVESMSIDLNDNKSSAELFTGSGAFACGLIQSSAGSLLLGGAPYATNPLRGKVAGLRLWSVCLATPPDALSGWEPPQKGAVGAWTCTSTDAHSVRDDIGRNEGKFRGGVDEVKWVRSPFASDAQLAIYLNGNQSKVERPTAEPDWSKAVAGPHQMTLGNAILAHGGMRFMAMDRHFKGELDELRIWETPRTRENICDTMVAKLTDVSPHLAIYYSFETPGGANTPAALGVQDDTLRCWHLDMLRGKSPAHQLSSAPVGNDAPCVTPVFDDGATDVKGGTAIRGRPSVAEYGDMTTSVSGAIEGSFKRAYGYIDVDANLVLITGHKIGSLVTEWISQIQTAPTLVGYIEGAPPIAAENYTSRQERLTSAVRWVNAGRISYSYSSRHEEGSDFQRNITAGGGYKWQTSAGVGVMVETSAGHIKALYKSSIDTSNSSIQAEVAMTTTHTAVNVRSELSGTWSHDESPEGRRQNWERFDASNTGIALVESEVADLFALRLKRRGGVMPLVAYQMRPNPDIPKDRNLVSFAINPRYTKQGCLDGRRGLDIDIDFPAVEGTGPTQASYLKPAEAYAWKERIRRSEEQLASEHERYQTKAEADKPHANKPPKRSKRNICNSYVWTADGGTFQETHTNVDFVQQEIGGTSSNRDADGFGIDGEASFFGVLGAGSLDLMWTTHINLMLTKDVNSENSFELQAELPGAVDIRSYDVSAGKMVKRPGAVDAYRWMSFWLEPSAEATDVFFNQVVDPEWLEDPSDADARVLRSLAESLKKEKGDARTKAWRVFHRCTYVSRVPERIPPASGGPPSPTSSSTNVSKSKPLFDLSANWLLVQAFDPRVRSCKTKAELKNAMRQVADSLFPTLLSQPRLWSLVVDAMSELVGIEA